MAKAKKVEDIADVPKAKATKAKPRAKVTKAEAIVEVPKAKAYDTSRRIARRLSSIPSARWEVNTLIQTYGNTGVSRSRHLCLNNPYASKAKEEFASALIGDGIYPASKLDNKEWRQAIRDLWTEFAENSDADGITDLYGQQTLIANELFEAGEAFVRIRPRRESDGLTIPLQLQVLPAEMLPFEKNETGVAPGNYVHSGIEFNPIGQRVAYHFYKYHPGVNASPSIELSSNFYTRVPASEVLHIYKPIRAGQIRGIPRIISSMVTLAMMDSYDDAELERKRTVALFAAFVKRPKGDDVDHPFGAVLNDTDVGSAVLTTIGREFVMSPGAVIELEPGEDVAFSEPADVGSSYEMFQYRMLIRAAAGIGVPYSDMTGDLKGANYSSIRAGLLSFRRKMKAEQKQIITPQLCKPVFKRFLETATLANNTPWGASELASNMRSMLNVTWVYPAFDWVDPLKDMQAEDLAVQRRYKSRSAVILERGEDPEELDNQIARDKARDEANGFVDEVAEKPAKAGKSKDEETVEQE